MSDDGLNEDIDRERDRVDELAERTAEHEVRLDMIERLIAGRRNLSAGVVAAIAGGVTGALLAYVLHIATHF